MCHWLRFLDKPDIYQEKEDELGSETRAGVEHTSSLYWITMLISHFTASAYITS